MREAVGCECERARQAQVCGLQTSVCILSENDVIEMSSTEVFYQGLVRVLFDINGGHSGFLLQDPGVNESDLSAFWIREPSPVVIPPVVLIKEAPMLSLSNPMQIAFEKVRAKCYCSAHERYFLAKILVYPCLR